MMNFFKKDNNGIFAIKLYKITDQKLANEFDIQSLFLSTISLVEEKTGLSADGFHLNFTKNYKTLDGFKRALLSLSEIAYGFVGFNSNKTNSSVIADNPMLNYIKKPKKSSVTLCIQIAENYISEESTLFLAESILNEFDFDYGYIHKFPSNFDITTERKIKKGFLSTEVEVNEIDHAWTFHQIAILEGYIKKLYKVNYLIESQISTPILMEAISKYGELKKINEKIKRWTLTELELKNLVESSEVSKVCIITDGMDFLKTSKAKELNDLMKI